MIIKRKHRFMAEAGDQGGGGGAGAVAATAPDEAPSPAATSSAPPAVEAAPPAAAATPATPAAPAPAEAKGYWPDDWRSRAAKGDEKLISRFSRYGSPEDALDALVHAQNRINAGELKPVLGKDATPEQINEWRQAHGIPESPDKYDVADLGNGLKVPEPDKPLVDKILAAAHSSNQTPEQVKASLRAFYEVRDMVDAHMVEKDKTAEAEGISKLREEWGPEYQVHSNMVANLLAGSAAGDLQEQLMNGRLADGTLVKNSPAVQKFLLSLALIQNPLGTVVPSGGNPAHGIREELKRIGDLRMKDRTAYNKDDKLQQRERELITAAQRAGIMDESGNWK